ncbi:hypothetical protein [Deinococcus multiflagellatus]|uniref:CHRD domain-containing protein n=1 Tax=Deinococcus multiflagellatus TaxID=1656887 RepID=A0ABW1ZLJ0_9DEIO|nr:hypothetical protein [Deinococcus multiflagellatus]MBZ9714781.1 hypothetical protein [Deinococcus multiflagellatus]
MTRLLFALLTLLSLSAPAGALQLIVWDREMNIKLGSGESSGGRMTVRLVDDYDGPVVVLFAPSDDERARGTFAGLKSRYTGTLNDGQLILEGGTTLARLLTPFKLSVSLQRAGQSLSLPGLRNTGPGNSNK